MKKKKKMVEREKAFLLITHLELSIQISLPYTPFEKQEKRKKNRKVSISVPLCRDHKIFAVEDHGTEAMALQKRFCELWFEFGVPSPRRVAYHG